MPENKLVLECLDKDSVFLKRLARSLPSIPKTALSEKLIPHN
ncbi:hypothetical protein ACFLRM_02325 [Acidobacteriota bacterium]